MFRIELITHQSIFMSKELSQIIKFVFLSVLLTLAVGTPPNKLCATAVDLTEVESGTPISVDLNGADVSTSDFISCALTSFSRYVVWYTFDSMENIFVSASFCDTGRYSGNPSFYLLKGDCNANTCEALNDDACQSLGPAIEAPISPNTRYYLVLASTMPGEHEFYFELSHPEPITNDNCMSATPLVSGEVYIASVFTATYDTLGIGCPSLSVNSANVWFSFNSLSFNAVEISFCSNAFGPKRSNSDPIIYLLEGTCGSATCFQYNNDACGKLPSLSVPVSKFTDYLVSIGSVEATSPFSLEFTFNLTLVDDENDGNACSNSELIDSSNSMIVGSLVGAEVDPTSVNPASFDLSVCQDIDLFQNNVFYRFNSQTMNHLSINHCNLLGHSGTLAPVNFAIFTGSCEELMCVISRTDLCSIFGGEISIGIEQHTDYYIVVYGPAVEFMFELNLSFNMLNDRCDHAVEVHKGNLYSASLTRATADAPVFCFIPSSNVWYTFTTSATDAYVFISFCRNGAASAYDNFISLVTGDCRTASCVAFDDNSCGLAPELFTEVEKNTQYLFEIGGKGFKGDFTFYFDLLTENDLCETAEVITPGIISGSTKGSSIDAVSGVCGVPISPKGGNVWYQFDSEQFSNVTISTCAPEVAGKSEFDVEIFLYQGDNCANLNCVTGVDTKACGSSATLFAELLTFSTYFIAIGGASAGSFQFVLNLA